MLNKPMAFAFISISCSVITWHFQQQTWIYLPIALLFVVVIQIETLFLTLFKSITSLNSIVHNEFTQQGSRDHVLSTTKQILVYKFLLDFYLCFIVTRGNCTYYDIAIQWQRKIVIQIRMPIVKVSTNMGINQLPENFMQHFTHKLATVLGKPPGRMTWKLETDQPMSLLVTKSL